jgi:hypothetical protein
MNPDDAVQLLLRVVGGIIIEQGRLREEYGHEKKLGVIFPDFNVPQSVSVRFIIDMEGDV